MMLVFDEIEKRAAIGEPVALCVVVHTSGSTPQGKGAKMLCLLDGTTIGTLGGGCIEAEVRQRALRVLAGEASRLFTFRLNSDYGWDDGLICGGTMDIVVRAIRTPSDAESFAAVASTLKRDGSARFELPYKRDGIVAMYVEELTAPPLLLIAGAGHVGQSLAKLAAELGFDVDVIDDRSDYASAERFPNARRCLVGDVETMLADYSISADTYVVIVTRGHRNDGRVLEAVVRSQAKYIGLIGSKSKIKLIFKDLLSRGTTIDELLNVHAPIGLDIGSITVPEIALSIAAELVAVRRQRGTATGRAMKLDATELRTWLEANSG